MESQIGVESEPGKALLFGLRCGWKSRSDTPPLPKLAAVICPISTCWAVDNSATNRGILRYQLGAWQMRADSAASGQKALGKLRTAAESGQPYHLALLDVQMPETDALTLARAIKADRTLDDTRLIVLTSFGQAFSAAEIKAMA
jgi:two-component system sensor histidine kinase/response regulator